MFSPNELSELVIGCNAVKHAMGNTKTILPGEKPVMKFARECVVSINNISAGEKFTDENISTKRPGNGMSPMLINKLIGKKSKHNYKKDKKINFSEFKKK